MNARTGSAPADAHAAAERSGISGTAVPILMYHHVAQAPPRGVPSRYMFVSPRLFRLHMRMLKLMGYKGCSMADLGPYLGGEKTGKVVGITFDDGYRNVYENALPVLHAHGFTSTTYFVSRQVGGYNLWDAERMPRDDCMSLAELREWAAHGQEVGAHTLDHVRLGDLPPAEARRQIEGSKAELEDMVGRPVEAFSYPYGSHNDRVAETAREAGYATATTTVKAKATAADDPMRLPRLTAKRTDDPLRFALRRLM